MKNLTLFLVSFILPFTGNAQNWISLNSGTTNHLSSICFADSNTGYAVGWYGTILKTTDGGMTWTSQPYNNSYYFSDVQFLNPDTGYIAGYRTTTPFPGILLKTTDGGINWVKQQIDTTGHFNDLQLLGQDTIFINGSRILRTFDGGSNWSEVSTPEGGAFWACNADTYFLAGAYVELYNTTDGGENWVSQFFAAAPGGIYDLGFSNFSNGLAVGGGYSQGIYYELLYYTRAGGNPWQKSTYASDKYYFAVFFSDDTTAYVVGSEGSIIKTTDAGEHFTEESSGTSESLNDVYFTGSGTGYIVGSNGTILKSSAPVGLPNTPTPGDYIVDVFPNPFHDKLSISMNSRFTLENTTVALYDPLGRLLFVKATDSYINQCDVQSVIPGVYILKISNAKYLRVIKLIKE